MRSRGFPLGVVVSGLVRVYAITSEGRQATIRYVAAAEVFGLSFVVAPELFGEEPPVWGVRAKLTNSLHRLLMVQGRVAPDLWRQGSPDRIGSKVAQMSWRASSERSALPHPLP
jgi:hypothetical protein